jgi:hypothetical protein
MCALQQGALLSPIDCRPFRDRPAVMPPGRLAALRCRRYAAAAFIATLCAAFCGCGHSKATPVKALGPKVVVDRPKRYLGKIESIDDFTQTFVFRNVGDAPVTLQRGPSTCKCTVTRLPEKPIPPGGTAAVEIGFSEAAKLQTTQKGTLSRGVKVLTNDPQNPEQLLGIEATFRHSLMAEPNQISFTLNATDLAAEPKRTGETLVYSQRWKEFALSVGSNALPGAACRITPLVLKELRPLDALSGYRVQVVLPADMPDGHFAGDVDLVASVAGEAQRSRSLPLSVHGHIDGRVTIFGPQVDSHQVLRLGIFPHGKGACAKLLLKVCDARRELTVRRVECEPAFLRVRVAPLPAGSAKVGLYSLVVEVPGNAPSCDFSDGQAALVRLVTDHVHLPRIELPVKFTVLSDAGQSPAVADR